MPFDSSFFSAAKDAAYRAALQSNPNLTPTQFDVMWQTNAAPGMTGGPIAPAPGGYAPQAGRDTPGTGVYGQTGGAYDFGSLLHPAVPVAPAPAGTTPAVGVNPALGGIGGDRGDGGGGGDKDQGPSGEAPGTAAGTNTRGSLTEANAAIAKGAIGLGLGIAMGNPLGIAKGAIGLGQSLFGAKDQVDAIDPVTGAIDNSQNNQNSVDNNNNAENATGMQGVGSTEGSGQTEGASGAMGGPGGNTGGNGVGSGTGATGPGGGENGSGHDTDGGHGTDAGGNDASDGPGGGAGAWARGGIVGLLPATKGGRKVGEVSGRSYDRVANGIRAYGMGFANGGFANANTHGVGAGRSIPHGLVPGASPGRADALHASVKRGSYIMPADVVSSIGGGNTANGGAKLNNWVGGAGFKSGAGMPGTGFASGGLVDVRLSSGEYHVPPEFVRWLGKGDPDKGAKVLDGHVARIRAKQIAHIRNLPPPK